MNPEFPPLEFASPLIRPRRKERRGFNNPPMLTAERRREIQRRIRSDRDEIDRRMQQLSAEQRRAIFLRIKHDRPLTRNDFAGTDLAFMSGPGETESLVITRNPGFEKFDQRMATFAEGDEPSRPKGSELATALRSLELGEPKDRLSDEIFAAYDQWIAQDWLIYEIEVVSFATSPATQKRELESMLGEIRAALAHIHGHIFEHELSGRSAHVVLRSTGAKFREFVEEPKWWRKIVFFDARPRFETFSQAFEDFRVSDVTIAPPQDNAETICVIDSGVAALNPFLEPVLRRDISRSFVYGCSPTEDAYGHGSGVASLAAFYDIEYQPGGVNSGGAFVCSARVLTDEGQLDVPRVDDAREDIQNQSWLLSKLLRQVVSHFHSHGVRIFVLSLELQGHIWSHAHRRQVARNAWTARTLDKLSREFDVVFVTITGNVSPSNVADLLDAEGYPAHLLSPLAKVLDPGHAALAVTAGSVAHSARVVVAPHTAIAEPGQPSPFTRSGPGFGDSIKPDFTERGGNLVRDALLNSVIANAGTNVVMASSKLTPALQHGHGTSFAAPRVAHHLALILRDLRALGVEPSAPLLRAMLGVSARRTDHSELLDPDGNLKLLGFGLPDGFRALDCARHSALLFWSGTVKVDHTAIFKVHVPVELAGQAGRKRIVVSVASAPPVQLWGTAEYLGAEMKFRLFRGDRDAAQIEALMQRDEGEENVAASAGVDELSTELGVIRRSRGTLQVDTHTWSRHDPSYSGDDYTLGVSLTAASWCKEGEVIPIAVVVRVEDTTGMCDLLYARVQERNQARIRQSARAVSI